jgi:indole-3-glycerol phosphate synthase
MSQQVLDKIVAAKRAEHAKRAPVSLEELVARAAVAGSPRGFEQSLLPDDAQKMRVIAEFKRRSPSAGPIRQGADPALIAIEYARAGAAALSVLTDVGFFDGHAAHIEAARGACALPVIRKDFLLDERDVVESRIMGADAVLLIVRLLEPEMIAAMIETAHQVGLDTLVETHNDRELEIAMNVGASVIGVNHRDLDTLEIDLELSARARKLCGDGVILVAESGIKTREDVQRMRDHGADAILVGESLMKAPSPGAALEALLG